MKHCNLLWEMHKHIIRNATHYQKFNLYATHYRKFSTNAMQMQHIIEMKNTHQFIYGKRNTLSEIKVKIQTRVNQQQ